MATWMRHSEHRQSVTGGWPGKAVLLALAMGLVLLASRRAVLAQPNPTSDTKRPNIVFVLADDLGWTDLGCQGSQYYVTPHIDRLAATGVTFTRFYACPNCQPTRAALMSGQYGPRTGVYTVGSIDRFDWRSRPLRPVDNIEKLPLDKITVGQVLKRAGYATGYFGKWHLGQQGPYHPSQRGFDEAITTMGKHFHFDTQPKVDYPPDIYLADWLTDRAIDFIHRHRDEPFFLVVAHFAVHTPLSAKPDDIEPFRSKPPSSGHNNPVYAGMIASLDRSVGRLLAKLDEVGLSDNTVVIFSSDNGGVGGYEREGLNQRDITDNAPLRSGKGSLYEGGIRVPFLVRWPHVTPAGTRCDEPAIHVDLLPTLAQIAGAPLPHDYPLDGVSLAPLLRDPTAALDRPAVYQHFPGYLGAGPGKWRTTPGSAIITRRWKLIEYFEDSHLELYDLAMDLGESTNLAQRQPQVAHQLHQQLKAWRQAIGAPIPQPIAEQHPKRPQK